MPITANLFLRLISISLMSGAMWTGHKHEKCMRSPRITHVVLTRTPLFSKYGKGRELLNIAESVVTTQNFFVNSVPGVTKIAHLRLKFVELRLLIFCAPISSLQWQIVLRDLLPMFVPWTREQIMEPSVFDFSPLLVRFLLPIRCHLNCFRCFVIKPNKGAVKLLLYFVKLL